MVRFGGGIILGQHRNDPTKSSLNLRSLIWDFLRLA